MRLLFSYFQTNSWCVHEDSHQTDRPPRNPGRRRQNQLLSVRFDTNTTGFHSPGSAGYRRRIRECCSKSNEVA
jgi:hypothetical protein